MPPLIRGLMRAEAYDHATTSFQLLETHISWVILTGQYAYKLKKPVDLGFVDFTTLDRRRHFCDEEIRLNRRLAPDLYLGVRPIYGSEEQPTFVESGTPIEYAVQMQQFGQKDLLPAVLDRGELRPDHIDRLAATIANFHHQAAAAQKSSPDGTPEAVRAPIKANFSVLSSSEPVKSQAAVLQKLEAWSNSEYQRLRDWFQDRHDLGKIRECHGDLHLGNMVLLDDDIQPFDCLEFNPGLRWIDVISEIAFLVMDLQDRGRGDLGFRLLNRWLEQSGDYAGLTGWRWYFAYRALVRAKVAVLRIQQTEVNAAELNVKRQEFAQYIDLALRSIQPRKTALIVMHGLSGSGKSHVAQWIAEHFGAISLRSDVERKRLFGQWGIPVAKCLTGDMYAPEVTQTVYREILAQLAPSILEADFSVIIDAACLEHWQRSVFRELSGQLGVPCLILDVQADRETMRRRLLRRQAAGGDPSDADLRVLDRQLARFEPMTPDEAPESLIVDTESTSWEMHLDSELRRRLFLNSI